MIKIITTVIEAEFAFFQVMKKLVGTKAVELLHATFGNTTRTSAINKNFTPAPPRSEGLSKD